MTHKELGLAMVRQAALWVSNILSDTLSHYGEDLPEWKAYKLREILLALNDLQRDNPRKPVGKKE
jgi:hypothetical protein